MAHVTDLGFSIADLDTAVIMGDIRVQRHPDFPMLAIYNYTEEVQYKNKWNKITLACRGLIINRRNGEVVARPWEKFFNFGQRDNRIDSDAPVEVTDKMDGSLGILYRRPDGKFAIATRGSFASDQAIHATELLHKKYGELFDEYCELNQENVTLLFEIIYPDNRIVCDYGDMDDLVLLGAVNKSFGYYYGPYDALGFLSWPGPITEVWNYPRFVDALSFADRKGKEGVVIRSGTNIVKLKQADYVELHRIVTNLSPKTVWEMLSAGKSVTSICSEIPDEFHKYVTDIADELLFQHSGIKFEANVEFSIASEEAFAKVDENGNVSRRAWAEAIKKRKHAGLLFMILDGKSIDDSVWKMIKPRGDIKTLVKDEG